MADVSKIQGPSGPTDPGKKEKASADAEKFHEAMRKKTSEVGKIDPDEQKKRKQREEKEEEPAAPPTAPTQPDQVVPFEGEKASPLDLQKGGKGISPLQSAQPTQARTPPTTRASFFQAPSTEEMSDDSGVLEEESFGVGARQQPGLQAPPPQAAPPQASPPPQAPPPSQQPQSTPSKWTPEGQQPVTPGPPESAQPQRKQPAEKKPGQAPVGPPKGKKETVPGLAPHLESPLKEEQAKQAAAAAAKETGIPPKAPEGLTPSELEETQTSKVQDTRGFFEQLGKGKEGKKEGRAEKEMEKQAAEQGAAAAAQPMTFSEYLESEKKQEEGTEATTLETAGMPTTPSEAQVQAAPLTPEALPPYANLHPQVQELFDRMVGVMTVMNMSGMTETVITLNAPQFASSVFFGTQIIIQEFSTAPQAFNIQLSGTPQAVALFQANANDLMAAFQAGNYNFRVNRLETSYLTERPLFKRKEKASGDNQDQPGDSPR